MEIFTLPEYFAPEKKSSVQVHDYKTRQECSKQMVKLQQHVFSFLQAGHKEVITGQASFSIHTDQFLLMKSGHCLMTEKLSGDENYRSILFFFSDELVQEIIQSHSWNPSSEQETTRVWPLRYDPFINTFVKSLLDLNRSSAHIQSRVLKIKLEELILYLADTQGQAFLSLFHNTADDQNRHFLQVVENNKLNKLSLKELAFLAHVSVSTFKREFEKHFHESPSKWFHDQRLEYSAYLLKSKRKRPSDIFQEVGYESLSNFIQAFKAKFGITPKQYQMD